MLTKISKCPGKFIENAQVALIKKRWKTAF
jgi:hypothetical protein